MSSSSGTGSRQAETGSALSVFASIRDKLEAAGPGATGSEIDHRRQKVAGLIRCLTERFLVTDAAADRLDEVSQLLERATTRLDQGGGAPGQRYDRNPVVGKANPVAPPMTMWSEPGRVVGSVTMGPQFQGPPGSVHGGFVAALLDEILGAAQVLSGRAGMTGSIAIRYLRPTPLNVPLVLEATLDGTEGRKLLLSSRCMHANDVTAEATGVFVTVTNSQFGLDGAEQPVGGGN